MEINKITIYVCITTAILLFVAILHLNNTDMYKWYDIAIGLLTAFVATLVLSITNYLYERKKIIESIYEGFAEIYYTLGIYNKKMGQLIVNKTFTGSAFKLYYDFGKLIDKTYINSKVETYSGFPFAPLNKIINKLIDFSLKDLLNLNNITNERYQDVLNYQILLQSIEVSKVNGTNERKLNEQIQNANLLYESLLVTIAKLHEYEMSLKIKLDTILTELDSHYKFSIKWQDRKSYIESSIKTEGSL